MVDKITFEGRTIFGDVNETGGVWASVKELDVCGGVSTKVVDAVVYDVIGGGGKRVMRRMSCRVLIPAEDLDQSRGRYYGRIVTRDRRVLRFFIQVDGRNLREVCRQKVTEPFISCQSRGFLVSWQDLTCRGACLFLNTVMKGPIDTEYVDEVRSLQQGSGMPVLRGRANEKRFGRVARVVRTPLTSKVAVRGSDSGDEGSQVASDGLVQATTGLGSDVCGLLGRVGYMCLRVGNVGHMLVLRELIVTLVDDGEEPGWVDDSILDFPVRVQLQGEGGGGAIAAVRAFKAGVERLASKYTLEDVRILIESCGDERYHYDHTEG